MVKAKSKGGRPKALLARKIQLQIRLTSQEDFELTNAAAADSRPVSQWVRLAALEKARSNGK